MSETETSYFSLTDLSKASSEKATEGPELKRTKKLDVKWLEEQGYITGKEKEELKKQEEEIKPKKLFD